jgi:hypothetical protein
MTMATTCTPNGAVYSSASQRPVFGFSLLTDISHFGLIMEPNQAGNTVDCNNAPPFVGCASIKSRNAQIGASIPSQITCSRCRAINADLLRDFRVRNACSCTVRLD